MTENKTSKKSTEVRGIYEPVQVKVIKVTPLGVLCQSGGLLIGPSMTQWGGGSSSDASI